MTSHAHTLWVLGNGQLGAMLQQAAAPLALTVHPVDIESEQTLPLAPEDLVTAEREQWPETDATRQLASHPHFINRTVFGRLADRFTQKSLLDELQLATAPWCLLDDQLTEADLHARMGENVLLKRRTGGYDGKGQHWLRTSNPVPIPADWRHEAIAEQGIAFDEEVSLVGVRGANGDMFFYPLTLNLHQNGILYASIAPLERLRPLQTQAEAMLGKIMTALDYVGVMAMETFRVGDQLLINELAPRVHNSGHWTQAGASVSQFENHVRATVGLPLAPATLKGVSMMINLIGVERNDDWLSVLGVSMHWYNKEVREGRKVGHLNVSATDVAGLHQAISGLQVCFATLPPEHSQAIAYQQALSWVENHLP